MPAAIDPIVGRYVHVTLDGRPHRLYFEEAGQGIPLVCLHTAGADGRQFRHLMTDAAVTDAFPRARLRPAVARQVVAAGGLARRGIPAHHRRPTPSDPRFCARARAAQAGRDGLLDRRADRAQPRDPPRRRVPRADRAGSRRLSAALVRHQLAAPAGRARRRGLRRAGLRPDRAAEPARRRAGRRCGTTCRAAPACSRAISISIASTATCAISCAGSTRAICPLYLMTGEYDFSCTPEDTIRTARQIPGAEVDVMKEVGHFPMSENPATVPPLYSARARSHPERQPRKPVTIAAVDRRSVCLDRGRNCPIFFSFRSPITLLHTQQN